MQQQADQQANNKVDQIGSKVPVYGQIYGLAKQGEGIGKSFIAKDQYGRPQGTGSNVANEFLTPDHEAFINNANKKNYTAAGLDLAGGLGKFGRSISYLAGKENETSGGWGNYNKFVGVDNMPQARLGGMMPCYNCGGMHKYPMGGQVPEDQANAEIEKQENVRYPDGETEQFDGASHEQGGIPVNLPQNTEIFSDKLQSISPRIAAFNGMLSMRNLENNI